MRATGLKPRFALPLLLLLGLGLGGCGGKMPSLGFGGNDSKPPPLANAADTPTTAYDLCAPCLMAPDGKRVPASASLRGYIDAIERQGDKVVISGWAADAESKQPAVEVVLVSTGKVIGRARMTVARPDVAQVLQFAGSNNIFGYRLEVEAAQVSDPNGLFAIDQKGHALKLDAPRR